MSTDPIRAKSADEETRAPSGYQLEQAVSAWQQLRARLITDPELLTDEITIAHTLSEANVADPRDLLARCIDATVWAERRATEAQTLEYEYRDRRERYEKRGEQLRHLIERLMDALPVTKATAKLATAALQAARPALVVTDETKLPDEYFRTTRTLNRTELTDDLRQGVLVDGAHLSQGGTVLVLRKLR